MPFSVSSFARLLCNNYLVVPAPPPSVRTLGLPADPKGGKSVVESSSSNAKPRERTLEELRAECRTRGMTGFSHLKKNELIRRMEGTYIYTSKGGVKSTYCSTCGEDAETPKMIVVGSDNCIPS